MSGASSTLLMLLHLYAAKAHMHKRETYETHETIEQTQNRTIERCVEDQHPADVESKQIGTNDD